MSASGMLESNVSNALNDVGVGAEGMYRILF